MEGRSRSRRLLVVPTVLAVLLSVIAGTRARPEAAEADATWTVHREVPSGSGPSARDDTALAGDPNGNVVLFGGSVNLAPVAETWVWDGSSATWTQKFPEHSPPPLASASMTLDLARREVVLFGGSGPGDVPAAGTWTWDGIDWTHRCGGAGLSECGPTPRHSAGLAAGPTGVVLFGGETTGSFPHLADTWLWNGTMWIEKTPESESSPSGRGDAAMSLDPRGDVVLFGGYGVLPTGKDGRLNDTWLWDGTGWSQKCGGGLSACGPSARRSVAAAFDPGRGATVMFGGSPGVVPTNETWSWDGARWTQEQPAQSPTPRSDHAMATDDSTNSVVMFGPMTSPGETWVYGEPSTAPSTTTTLPAVAPKSADLSVSMGDAPDPVVAGADISYSINIGNAGPDQSAASVSFRAPGLGYKNSSGSCGPIGNGAVTCSTHPLQPGESNSIQIVMNTGSMVAAAGATVEVQAPEGIVDPSPGNNYATATTTIQSAEATPGPDLSLSVQDDPDPVDVDSWITYSFTVTNNSPDKVSEASTITAAWPPLTFGEAENPGWTDRPRNPQLSYCQTNSSTSPFVCELGRIGPGESARATVRFRPKRPGLLRVQMSVASDGDRNSSNDSVEVVTTVKGLLNDLSVTIDGRPNPARPDGEVTHLVTVVNGGPEPAPSVVLFDSLPPGVDYKTGRYMLRNPNRGEALEPAVCNYDASAHLATCGLGTLSVNEERTVSIIMIPRQEGSFTNSARAESQPLAGGPSADVDPSNNQASATMTVCQPANCAKSSPGPSPTSTSIMPPKTTTTTVQRKTTATTKGPGAGTTTTSPAQRPAGGTGPSQEGADRPGQNAAAGPNLAAVSPGPAGTSGLPTGSAVPALNTAPSPSIKQGPEGSSLAGGSSASDHAAQSEATPRDGTDVAAARSGSFLGTGRTGDKAASAAYEAAQAKDLRFDRIPPALAGAGTSRWVWLVLLGVAGALLRRKHLVGLRSSLAGSSVK